MYVIQIHHWSHSHARNSTVYLTMRKKVADVQIHYVCIGLAN